MQDDRMGHPVLLRLIRAIRLERFAAPASSLFEFRRLGVVPAWMQLLVVVGLFVLAVFLTHSEYVERGTCFGFPGPAFNMLFNPIYEELIFRGWILGQLARHRSNLLAVVVSSLLFGVVHVRNIYWMETVPLIKMMASAGFVTGPLFAYLTLRFRSLWPAVILHYLNNLAYYVRN